MDSDAWVTSMRWMTQKKSTIEMLRLNSAIIPRLSQAAGPSRGRRAHDSGSIRNIRISRIASATQKLYTSTSAAPKVSRSFLLNEL